MKVLFLDFDGVLNSHQWMQANADKFPMNHMWHHTHLDELAVGRLEKIVQATGAKVVISSTWRLLNSLPRLCDILQNHGFTGEVIGITPRLGGPRGNEIASWLNDHGPIENFVIIDDDGDMVHLKHKLVQTSWDLGLQDEHVDAAIEQLNA